MGKKKLRVGIQMFGIPDLGGGGGAERQFGTLYDHYNEHSGSVDLYLITDAKSIANLSKVGLIKNKNNLIITDSILPGRWNYYEYLSKIVFNRLDLIHIVTYNSHYPFLKRMDKLPATWKPKIVINVEDCSMAEGLENHFTNNTALNNIHAYFKLTLETIAVDGVNSWYKALIDTVKKYKIARPETKLHYVSYCYTDLNRFSPDPVKENWIIFAGRLDHQKDPVAFVNAIHLLNKKNLLQGWKVKMYGKGILAEAIDTLIQQHQLEQVIERGFSYDLSPVLNKSRLFVSTQHYENFTSLAMLEAMAGGNAIIAKNAGQTYYFVKEGKNGFLSPEEQGAEGIAAAIEKYLQSSALHEDFQRESVRIAREVHNINNFKNELETYWKSFFNL